MNFPLMTPPIVPNPEVHGPNEPQKSGDGTGWNKNMYQRANRRRSRLDGKPLILQPAATVSLSDKARGLNHRLDDEFFVYDRYAKLQKLKSPVARTRIL